MGSLLMRAGSEDRVSGYPGLLDAIGHAFVRGRLTLNLEVCMANSAVSLVSLAMGHRWYTLVVLLGVVCYVEN